MTTTNCPKFTDVIKTSVKNKIYRFLDGTARLSQFAVIFGSTGRGKSFHSRKWAEEHPGAFYVRPRSGCTITKLRRHISGAVFNSENMSESTIIKYFIDNPGSVLIVDEATHLLGNCNYKSEIALDSVRDIYDEVSESGGRIGVVMIFTGYNLERLQNCRLSSFFEQFINRFDNHLDLGTKISFPYEIKPTVEARLPGADPEILEFFRQFNDIRSVHKRIDVAKYIETYTKQPVSLPMLRKIQEQFDKGVYKDEL